MKFAYPENEKFIKALANAKNRDTTINAQISDLVACSKLSEKTARRMAAKKCVQAMVDSWTKRAIRFQERANELQLYLDERNQN